MVVLFEDGLEVHKWLTFGLGNVFYNFEQTFG